MKAGHNKPMSAKELSQLYWLNREIEMDQKRLSELEAAALAPHSSGMDGMPRATGCGDALSRCVAEIIDLKAIIAAKQQQYIHERNRLERYIVGIPDSLTRQIFTLRFIDGLSWRRVAYSIGGGNTEDSVKKVCYRYLGTEGRKEKESCPECPDIM